MDLNDLAVFVRVIEAGSFTGAARLLGLPKATVSRRVAELERALGVRLLQRTTRSLSVTDAGRLYYEQSSQALRTIEIANQQLAETTVEPSGTLRVSAPMGMGQSPFIDAMSEFLVAHPKVKLELILSDDLLNLVEEGIDLAFRSGVLSDSTLVARKIGETHRILCASPAYLRRHGAPATLSDLRRHECVISGRSLAGVQWTLHGPRGRESVPVGGRVAVNEMFAVVAAAMAGHGIALVPHNMVGQAVQRRRLVHVLPKYATSAGGFYAVYPSSRHLSPAVKIFVDMVAKRFPVA